ncbi:MAG: hypothetical protein PHF11_05255 [Candidatus Omnitrophica bacterium]|nr:hypothetical protein [Candidatus Omnitrophota bacterium]
MRDLGLILNAWVLLIYGGVCLISIIFTFSLETYFKIDRKLNFIVLDLPLFVTILDKIYIDCIEFWMLRHNRIIGPFLIMISLTDMYWCFSIVNRITAY